MPELKDFANNSYSNWEDLIDPPVATFKKLKKNVLPIFYILFSVALFLSLGALLGVLLLPIALFTGALIGALCGLALGITVGIIMSVTFSFKNKSNPPPVIFFSSHKVYTQNQVEQCDITHYPSPLDNSVNTSIEESRTHEYLP